MRHKEIIGICGGIGSGKSVVSRLLRLEGFSVYDCDSEARRLMDGSQEIKRRIRDEISPEVTDGIIPPRRDLLARIVFSDEEMRRRLNAIVHGAIRKDLSRHAAECPGNAPVFVEAAILAESGLAAMCGSIWRVEASREERLRRVTGRDSCSLDAAESRMVSQRRDEEMMAAYEWKTSVIVNEPSRSLLRQIESLLESL